MMAAAVKRISGGGHDQNPESSIEAKVAAATPEAQKPYAEAANVSGPVTLEDIVPLTSRIKRDRSFIRCGHEVWKTASRCKSTGG